MVNELLDRGEPLDEIIFCDTGYEFPIMYIDRGLAFSNQSNITCCLYVKAKTFNE